VAGGGEFIPGSLQANTDVLNGMRSASAIYGHRHGLFYESFTTFTTEPSLREAAAFGGRRRWAKKTSSERSEPLMLIYFRI
jgi:hypothetical protein